jgi:hypothetical protein
MSTGNVGRCYIFVDEKVPSQDSGSSDLGRTSLDGDPDLNNPVSRRRRRSFVAALMRKARLQGHNEIVEICVPEEQKIHPVEIPGADLIIVSWDTANGDGGRGSDQTLQFFATEGRSRLNDVLNPYNGYGAVLFCECQTVQGLPVQAAYDAIFGIDEITVLGQTLKAEVRFGTQAYPARFWHRTHPILRGYEWPMRQAFGVNVPDGRKLQLFAPDVYEMPDETNPTENNPLIHFRRESLWFGWFTEWKRGWVPLLIADFSARAEAEYSGRPEVPAVLLAKKTSRGYVLASTLWLAGMPGVGRFLQRLQDPDWEEINSYHRRVRLSQFLKDSTTSLGILVIAVLLSVAVVQTTLESSLGSPLRNAILGSGLTVISIFNIGVVRGWRHLWKRPYGIGTLRWFLYPLRSFLVRRQSTWR